MARPCMPPLRLRRLDIKLVKAGLRTERAVNLSAPVQRQSRPPPSCGQHSQDVHVHESRCPSHRRKRLVSGYHRRLQERQFRRALLSAPRECFVREPNVNPLNAPNTSHNRGRTKLGSFKLGFNMRSNSRTCAPRYTSMKDKYS